MVPASHILTHLSIFHNWMILLIIIIFSATKYAADFIQQTELCLNLEAAEITCWGMATICYGT